MSPPPPPQIETNLSFFPNCSSTGRGAIRGETRSDPAAPAARSRVRARPLRASANRNQSLKDRVPAMKTKWVSRGSTAAAIGRTSRRSRARRMPRWFVDARLASRTSNRPADLFHLPDRHLVVVLALTRREPFRARPRRVDQQRDRPQSSQLHGIVHELGPVRRRVGRFVPVHEEHGGWERPRSSAGHQGGGVPALPALA